MLLNVEIVRWRRQCFISIKSETQTKKYFYNYYVNKTYSSWMLVLLAFRFWQMIKSKSYALIQFILRFIVVRNLNLTHGNGIRLRIISNFVCSYLWSLLDKVFKCGRDNFHENAESVRGDFHIWYNIS